METQKKEILRKKLAENAEKRRSAEMDAEFDRIRQEIDDFSSKYTKNDRKITDYIANILSYIDLKTPAAPSASQPAQYGRMHLCFLCGSAALLEISVSGSYADFMRDLDDWSMLSPYLLLINDDFTRFIYIGDDGSRTEGTIKKE